MRFAVLITILCLGFAAPAVGQETGAEPPPEDANVAELEELMARIQARVEAIDAAAAERNQALEFLSKQVEEASRNLTSQDEANENLQQKNADLDLQLESLVESRSELDQELARLATERDTLVEDLQTRVASLSSELQVALGEKEALSRELEDAQLAAAGGEEAAAEREAEVAALRKEVAALNASLESSKSRTAELDRRLKVALANKVEDLARYRSEFFGRLRQVLGEHPDIRVVGDRFVFQSEILFESGSAELGPEGQGQMGRLARTLIDLSREIPREIDWVLRVDGHTDSQPISTPDFPSNWELSTARAISVVKYLIRRGLPPQRLAATGFGQFQPIDPGRDEIAYRRNRRIELKLTQR